jgi:hypothetical protein
MDREEAGVLIALLTAVLVSTCAVGFFKTWTSDVKSEKVFIIGNATYKCKQTNKLEIEK